MNHICMPVLLTYMHVWFMHGCAHIHLHVLTHVKVLTFVSMYAHAFYTRTCAMRKSEYGCTCAEHSPAYSGQIDQSIRELPTQLQVAGSMPPTGPRRVVRALRTGKRLLVS